MLVLVMGAVMMVVVSHERRDVVRGMRGRGNCTIVRGMIDLYWESDKGAVENDGRRSQDGKTGGLTEGPANGERLAIECIAM